MALKRVSRVIGDMKIKQNLLSVQDMSDALKTFDRQMSARQLCDASGTGETIVVDIMKQNRKKKNVGILCRH